MTHWKTCTGSRKTPFDQSCRASKPRAQGKKIGAQTLLDLQALKYWQSMAHLKDLLHGRTAWLGLTMAVSSRVRVLVRSTDFFNHAFVVVAVALEKVTLILMGCSHIKYETLTKLAGKTCLNPLR
jgi:hypothetical protein